MSIKITLSVDNNSKEECIEKTTHCGRKSVVDVFFPDRHITYTYYNDKFDLKCGDIVYVEGKLEGLRGRVVKVNYIFKIKLSDYKRVIGVADTNISGKIYMAGSHFITIDENALPFDKVISWFKAPNSEEDDFITSTGDESFNLAKLSDMNIDNETAKRGKDYYIDNRVAYIELNNEKGRAIVIGSMPYEVEFNYRNGEISGLVCNCYCSGACKHEFATMLQLKETLNLINDEYGDDLLKDYLAIISKSSLFEYVIFGKTQGKFIIE